jgi:hypothetical protein
MEWLHGGTCGAEVLEDFRGSVGSSEGSSRLVPGGRQARRGGFAEPSCSG